MDELREGQRGACFAAADHGAVEDDGWFGESSSLVEGTLHSLYKLNLAVVWLNVESGEEFIIVGVIDEFRVLNDDCLICILIVLFQSFDAELEIPDESLRDLYLFARISETLTLHPRENAHNFDEYVNQLKDLAFIDFEVDFVLPDEIGHIKKCDEFKL